MVGDLPDAERVRGTVPTQSSVLDDETLQREVVSLSCWSWYLFARTRSSAVASALVDESITGTTSTWRRMHAAAPLNGLVSHLQFIFRLWLEDP